MFFFAPILSRNSTAYAIRPLLYFYNTSLWYLRKGMLWGRELKFSSLKFFSAESVNNLKVDTSLKKKGVTLKISFSLRIIGDLGVRIFLSGDCSEESYRESHLVQSLKFHVLGVIHRSCILSQKQSFKIIQILSLLQQSLPHLAPLCPGRCHGKGKQLMICSFI